MHCSIPLLAAGSLLAAVAAWPAPANPNANEDAKKLLAYLVGISGSKILSGQESMFSVGSFPSYQDRFKDLWIYTFNYLTNAKKCNNLLWVFSVNWWGQGSTGKASPSFYCPGDAYVDILGCDVYTNYGHSYGKYVHDELLKLGGGKPIAFTENGPMPDVPALRADQPKWVYWLTWWGFETTVSGTQMNSDAAYARVYGDPSVITQDEVNLSPASVLPGVSSPDAGRVGVAYRPDGIAFAAPAGFDRVVLHSLQGRTVALLPTSPEGGFISGGRFPAGAYLLRAYGPDGHTDARINLGLQR